MALHSTPELHYSLPACGVCGCDDVDVDYVEDAYVADAVRGGTYALELGECTRCNHRWTRPLRLPSRREARSAAAVRVLQQPAGSIPSAA